MAILKLATAVRNALADAAVAKIDAGSAAGKVLIYDGAMPANPNTAVSTQTLLATVVLADPSFAAAVTGVATGSDPASVDAVADGVATWFRAVDSDGNAVMDGDVTETGGGGTCQLSSTSIVTGGAVDITSLSITMPAS